MQQDLITLNEDVEEITLDHVKEKTIENSKATYYKVC